ncbi:MAG: CoA transferase [Novosphingobium sp.]
MQARFAAHFASLTRDKWTQIFDGADACVTPVLTLDEAFVKLHNIVRGTYAPVDGQTKPAPAPGLLGTPSRTRPAEKVTGAEALRRWTSR